MVATMINDRRQEVSRRVERVDLEPGDRMWLFYEEGLQIGALRVDLVRGKVTKWGFGAVVEERAELLRQERTK